MLRAFDSIVLRIFLFALTAMCARSRVGAAEPNGMVGISSDDRSKEGVVLLNDGGVLRGRVALEGDRYIVTDAKSRVEVSANKVALACESMTAAYDQQRRQLPYETTESHLGLADWCLRYDMLPQAAQELADARRLDPRNVKLDLLQRRFDVATQAAAPRKAVEEAADESNQQSAEEVARLEAIAAQLPSGAVERFTRKVQPILVNNCTTSGCHQVAGKQVFQLDRAVLHGLSNRRSTLSNLAATLALVNRSAPQTSPMLSIPRADHADMKQPILGSRQDAQFRQLEEWVSLVTGTPMPEEEKLAATKPGVDASGKRGSAAKRRGKTSPIQTARTEVKPPAADEPSTGAASAEPAASGVVQAGYDEPLPFQQLRERKRSAPQLKSWEPKDAFDPEIFNRQYPSSNSAESQSDRPAASATPAAGH
jgi:hypothetical protein